eukprot:scaffold93833_cov23-Prasinocladus_malaysianus.AAC.1
MSQREFGLYTSPSTPMKGDAQSSPHSSLNAPTAHKLEASAGEPDSLAKAATRQTKATRARPRRYSRTLVAASSSAVKPDVSAACTHTPKNKILAMSMH